MQLTDASIRNDSLGSFQSMWMEIGDHVRLEESMRGPMDATTVVKAATETLDWYASLCDSRIQADFK